METRTDLTAFAAKIGEVRKRIADVVVGQTEAVDMLLTCIIADGHVLLEGVPGVAKTLLARLMSRLLADILLADEINRAPAKTQAALFEVMEERQATIDGTSYKMGDVYTIIATQNPIEQEGTYRLPEAQLDRFLMKITMGYPSLDDEVEILRRHNEHTSFARLEDVEPIITKEELTELRKMMDSVVVDPSLLRYIAQIVGESRESAAVYVGCSPRASVAMLNCAKAYALIGGRDFVVPDDIKTVAPYIMQHRLQLTAESEMEGFTPIAVAHKLIDKVEVPK